MKKVMLLIAFGLAVSCTNAQKLKSTEVPAAVKDSFAKRFPAAKDVAWSKEGETDFEAEFRSNGKEQSVNFDTSGKWLETETEIKKSEIPAAVQATLAKEFAGYKIEEAEITETPDGTFYEIEIEKGESNYEVQIAKDGKLIKKEEMKERDDEKD